MKSKKTILALAVAMLLSACGGGEVSSDTSKSDISSNSNSEVTSEITSEMTSEFSNPVLTIEANATKAFVGDEIQLTVNYDDNGNHTTAFTVIDDTGATVDASGKVTATEEGIYLIKATCVDDPMVEAATIQVRFVNKIVNFESGHNNWDFSDLLANGKIKTTTNNAEWPYAEVMFNVEPALKYFACATIKVLSSNPNDVWNRFSLGQRNVGEGDNYTFRGYHLSCLAGTTNIQKCITLETPNNWGITGDRYQFWNFYPYTSLNSKQIQLSLIRDNNTFYYYVDGTLYNVESLDTRFLSVKTVPTIVAAGTHVEVSEMVYTTDKTILDQVISDSKAEPKLLPSTANNYFDDDGNLIFNDKTITNIKDYGFRSTGDAFRIDGGVDVDIEYDVEFTEFTEDKTAASMVLNFNRYNGPVYADDTRGFYLTREHLGYQGWNMNGDLPHENGVKIDIDEEDFIKVNEVHHIKISRRTTGWKLLLDGGTKYNMDWGWDEYNQAMIMWFGARCCKAKVSNFTITEL